MLLVLVELEYACYATELKTASTLFSPVRVVRRRRPAGWLAAGGPLRRRVHLRHPQRFAGPLTRRNVDVTDQLLPASAKLALIDLARLTPPYL